MECVGYHEVPPPAPEILKRASLIRLIKGWLKLDSASDSDHGANHGKQANGMNVESGRGGVDDKGPLPKANKRSLKLASHAMKKEVLAPRLIEERQNGSIKNRQTIGIIATNLDLPLGMNLARV
ncbi:hypothetical protein CQW23_27332 [Capsicum baccatum]|uniref:Uncharacterized protein n=1 Tax=Capsicum baccatum TaxID=33114 RepID=A0A2G2VDD2_CAPBA|nr:hypothetical protein CQW23_27332 [Capsicum baccatum]